MHMSIVNANQHGSRDHKLENRSLQTKGLPGGSGISSQRGCTCKFCRTLNSTLGGGLAVLMISANK